MPNHARENPFQSALEHLRQGRLTDAAGLLRALLEREPENAGALHYLGVVTAQSGDMNLAVRLLERASRLDPSNAVVLGNFGSALSSQGRLLEAEAALRRGLEIAPDLAEARFNLGNVLRDLKRSEEADATYREAIASRPDFAEAYNNRGSVLLDLGRLAEAEQCFLRAAELRPSLAEAHNNLGNARRKLGRTPEAETCYRMALQCRPGYAAAHFNLARALEALDRPEEAAHSYSDALVYEPGHLSALLNLGNLLRAARRTQEAEQILRQGLALHPDVAEIRSLWFNCRQQVCDWSGLEGHCEAIRALVLPRESRGILPSTLLAVPGVTPEEQHACARRFARDMFGAVLTRPPLFTASPQRGKRKLNIGYLSADFISHATSYLLTEIIELHERRRFQVTAYSYGPPETSPFRQRVQSAFDRFRDVRDVPDESAARQIVDDGVDILVDLKGYTVDARVGLMALRPAPIQVNWLGYPGTMGDRRLADYLIGDPVVTPPEHAAHYSESLALMPHCYQPNDRQRAISDRPSRAEAGLPDSGLVFSCFCQAYKITPSMFDIWCRLLRDVPASWLWLLQQNSAAEENLKQAAAARGISPQRLVFAAGRPLAAHLARLQLADLALDTFPYTSHTTASDALWAGVPMATIMGNTFTSRVAASILHAAGLPELVAADADSYYRLTRELATRPERLGAVRTRLEANRMSCPLFDSERFVRDLEHLYEKMWSNHCSGRHCPIG